MLIRTIAYSISCQGTDQKHFWRLGPSWYKIGLIKKKKKRRKLDEKFIAFNRVMVSKNSDADVIVDFIGKSIGY